MAKPMAHDAAPPNQGKTPAIPDTRREEDRPRVGPDDPAVHAIRAALIEGDLRLRQNDPAARRGDVGGVHRMRIAARRLRSELRLFRDLLEGDWADRLSRELRWLGGLLGDVRDVDVMQATLREAAGELVDDLGPLFAALADRRAAASDALRSAFEGERYRELFEHLAGVADQATFRDRAWEPCRSALPPLVLDSWKRVKSAGRALDLGDADEAYHEVRKRAKRARYSAESVAPALDPAVADDARRFARRAHTVQDILGAHQDAIIACQEVRRLVAEWPGDGPLNLAAGRLLERQEGAARDARARFFKLWRDFDRKKHRRWMRA